MLLQPHYLICADGSIVPIGKGKLRSSFNGLFGENTAIAVLPPPGQRTQDALLDNAISHAMLDRADIKVCPPDVAKVITDKLRTFLPANVVDVFSDVNISDAAAMDALRMHFKACIKDHKSKKTPPVDPGYVRHIEAMNKLWHEKMPSWLSACVSSRPVVLSPQPVPLSKGNVGLAIDCNKQVPIIKYNIGMSEHETFTTLTEEALHVAEGQSNFLHKHAHAITRETQTLKKRLYTRDEYAGTPDTSPNSQRARQHIRRHANESREIPFHKYKKGAWSDELLVDMAFIEAKLLNGQQTGKCHTQEEADKIMAKRFFEVHYYYKGFINECITQAAINLQGTLPRREIDKLEQQWRACPMAELARSLETLDRGGQRR